MAALAVLACVVPVLAVHGDDNIDMLAFEYRAHGQALERALRDQTDVAFGSGEEDLPQHRRIARGTRIQGSVGQSLQSIGLGGALTRIVEQALASRLQLSKDARAGDTLKVIVDADYVAGKFAGYGTIHALEYSSRRVGKLQAFWFEAQPGRGEFYDARGRSLRGAWLRTPLHFERISSAYNLKRRHPLLKRIVPHTGVDFEADRGTPVWAAADGQVTFAGRRGPNGNLVSVRHDSGYESHYAHLAKISPDIRPGRKLKQRQVLGYVGSTGRSTGPHLHFALKHDGRFVDPTSQLDGPGAPLPRELEPRFHAAVARLRAELGQIAVSGAPATKR
ncbi:MAG TPA: M23 family metallopeptidase [Polyangiales bacterium]|nr:M23 family metallopeptidase [Polyangiales bacterium]